MVAKTLDVEAVEKALEHTLRQLGYYGDPSDENALEILMQLVLSLHGAIEDEPKCITMEENTDG